MQALRFQILDEVLFKVSLLFNAMFMSSLIWSVLLFTLFAIFEFLLLGFHDFITLLLWEVALWAFLKENSEDWDDGLTTGLTLNRGTKTFYPLITELDFQKRSPRLKLNFYLEFTQSKFCQVCRIHTNNSFKTFFNAIFFL